MNLPSKRILDPISTRSVVTVPFTARARFYLRQDCYSTQLKNARTIIGLRVFASSSSALPLSPRQVWATQNTARGLVSQVGQRQAAPPPLGPIRLSAFRRGLAQIGMGVSCRSRTLEDSTEDVYDPEARLYTEVYQHARNLTPASHSCTQTSSGAATISAEVWRGGRRQGTHAVVPHPSPVPGRHAEVTAVLDQPAYRRGGSRRRG
ncbi:hypothetical protein DFH06DRAFT_1193619 [Mycena polygramma]|nr:hypothetical protein DFH06DRAFT_1193619 [Mycena polygramma]